MALDQCSLISVAEAKAYLVTTQAKYDALLETLIQGVSGIFEDYCNRRFKYPYLTAATIAFVDSDPDTITDTDKKFDLAGFQAEQALTVSGSTSNDTATGAFLTLSSVEAETLTLATADAVTAEGAAATITRLGNYSEYHDGDGSDRLVVSNSPINSVVCIHDDLDREYDSDTLIDSDDYLIDETGRYVQLDGGTFGEGYRNIRIVCNGGYSIVPRALSLACAEQVALKYRQSVNALLGVRSRNLPDGSVTTFMVDDILPQVKRVLNKYRIPVI